MKLEQFMDTDAKYLQSEKEKNMREAFLCRMKGKGQYVDLYILLPIVYSAQSRVLMEIR